MIEQRVGNIFAGILIALIIASIFYSLFHLVFADGHGLGLNGNRGEIYLSE